MARNSYSPDAPPGSLNTDHDVGAETEGVQVSPPPTTGFATVSVVINPPPKIPAFATVERGSPQFDDRNSHPKGSPFPRLPQSSVQQSSIVIQFRMSVGPPRINSHSPFGTGQYSHALISGNGGDVWYPAAIASEVIAKGAIESVVAQRNVPHAWAISVGQPGLSRSQTM